MEKIFRDSRVAVNDNGFSQGVIRRIYEKYPQPSRSIYRGPTLIAVFATVMVILVLTLTVGLGDMNDSYDKFANAISYHRVPINVDSDFTMSELECE